MNGCYYEINELLDGKKKIVGPMKTGGWPGFATDEKGFLYNDGKFFMSNKPEKDLQRKLTDEEVKQHLESLKKGSKKKRDLDDE